MNRARQGIRWTRWRRLTQLAVALFYRLLPVVNARGISGVSGNLASLRVGRFDLVEPAAGVSAILAGRHAPLRLLVGIAPLVLLALMLGPVFCSWVCPWGLASEAIDRLRPGRRWQGKPWLRLRRPRPFVLAAWLALGTFLSLPLIALVSAPRLITSLASEAIFLRLLSPVTGGLLAALFLLEVLGPRRIWCRVLCPVGALTNYLRWNRTLRITPRPVPCSCVSEPQCLEQCRWGLDPRTMERYDGCTNCLRCVEACPSALLAVRSGKEIRL